MNLVAFLRKTFAAPPRFPILKRKRSYRPMLERLEDRTVPSAVTVVAIQDATEGGANGIFRISREDTNGDLAVDYATDLPGSTAIEGEDVEYLAGNTTIPDGFYYVDVVVSAIDDSNIEGAETFELLLGGLNMGLPCDYEIGSPASATITILDDDRNDAPTGANNTLTTLEDTPYVFQLSDFGFSDQADSPANNFLAIYIPLWGSYAGGMLTDNGVEIPYQESARVTAANIANGLLIYTPSANTNSAIHAQIDFHVQDDGGTANGGVDSDPYVSQRLTLAVTAVNDAPSFEASELDPDFGGSEVTISNWASFAPGGGPDESSQTPTFFVSNVSNPTFFAVLPSVSAEGTLTYTLAQMGDSTATFDLCVQDDGGTANGGTDTGAATTFTVLVQNQNTLVVNSIGDNANVVVIDGQRFTSLRAAIALANATFATTDINFDLPANSTITIGASLSISANCNVNGPTPRSLTVERSTAAGTANFSVFDIGPQKEVTISNLTITNGRAQNGGGVSNSSIVSLLGVVLRNNHATSSGGGISAGIGTSTVLWDCLVTNNSAADYGGGISAMGTTWIQDFTEISNNSARKGGGIYNHAPGQLTIDTGSNIRINNATEDGGGIFNLGTLVMTDAFLSLNWAVNRGGGLFNGLPNSGGAMDVTFTNVSIEGNRATGAAGRGGGIYARVGAVEITGGSILKDNLATLAGGGNGACLWEGGLILSGINQIDDDIVTDPNPLL